MDNLEEIEAEKLYKILTSIPEYEAGYPTLPYMEEEILNNPNSFIYKNLLDLISDVE